MSPVRQCSSYAGIGSRKTPNNVLTIMRELAHCLAKSGYTLRSGAAPGADKAFENGCDLVNGKKEIFLPYPNFNGTRDCEYNYKTQRLFLRPRTEAYKIAAIYHPSWPDLKETAQHFHARNVHQMMGYDLDCIVDFVVCWTPDGCEHHNTRTVNTGGTGQAISIASLNNIPVFNLANSNTKEKVMEFCDCASMQYSDYLS